MACPFVWLVLCFAASPPVELRDTATTTLYVLTNPPGAQVFLDGAPAGRSGSILVVSPGWHTVKVDSPGYAVEIRRVEAVANEVTRVVLELRKGSPASLSTETPPRKTAQEDLDGAGAAAARAYIAGAEIQTAVREAIAAVLRQHPTQTRWAGQAGTELFGVAVKRLPSGPTRQRTLPALIDLCRMLAVQEMLKAKVVLDGYAKAGLTDATTLIDALEQAAGQLQIAGTAQGVTHQATARGDYAVAYVIAEERALAAHLLNPVSLEAVREAYRDTMHRQARELMSRKDWRNALLLWQHLHSRKLVSQQLYLDAARCFKELEQTDDALRVLSEAMTTFGDADVPEFFEKAGDLALVIPTDEAQSLAELAYRRASELLRETISGPAQDAP